jgi:hypothetical protein
MALLKNTVLPNGVEANYFRISELVSIGALIRLRVSLYLSAEARSNGATPIEENIYQKKIGLLPEGFSFRASTLETNLYGEAYYFLKTLPMFDGAVDI